MFQERVKKRCAESKEDCIIRVENTRAEKGRYIDAPYVKTDSALRPNIPIYITGVIQ